MVGVVGPNQTVTVKEEWPNALRPCASRVGRLWIYTPKAVRYDISPTSEPG
jgi:hypothetical protein